MAWQGWHATAPPIPNVVAPPIQSAVLPGPVNPAPAILPQASTAPGLPASMQYSPEQWAQMQQQNWQQWAQWQQQYQQWHQQYGAEYQKSMNALAAAGPPPNTAVPPPPPNENKPPPPPPPDDKANQYAMPPRGGYSTAPPPAQHYGVPPPQQYGAQNDWQQSPAPKRPLPKSEEFENNKRQMTENWNKGAKGGWQNQPPPSSQTQAQKTLNLEELTEAEKKFDKEFAAWEAQFNKWKEQNANHPDKSQYLEYEKKWESWRNSLLDRREQMRKKRVALQASIAASTPKPTVPPPVKPPPTKTEDMFNKPPPTLNNEPLSFKDQPKPAYIEESAEDQQEGGGSFLQSSTPSSGGIPGLDLVKEGANEPPPPDNPPEMMPANSQSTGPDLDAISKGINTILGDPKLLNMLSMVSQNHPQNLFPAGVNSQSTTSEAPPQPQKASAPIPSLLNMPVVPRPSLDRSDKSFDGYSDYNSGGQFESVNNFDDQTRMSFSNGPSEQELGYGSNNSFNAGRPGDTLQRNSFVGRPGNDFNSGRTNNFDGPPPNFKQSNFDGPPPNFKQSNFDGPPPNFKQNNFDGPPPNFKQSNNFDGPPPNFKQSKNFDGPPPNFKQSKKFDGPPPNFKQSNNFDGPSPKFNQSNKFDAPPPSFRQSNNFRTSNGPGGFNRPYNDRFDNYSNEFGDEEPEENWNEEDEYDKYHSIFNEGDPSQEEVPLEEPQEVLEPPPVDEGPLFVPEVVVDYEHKSLKPPEPEVALEITRMFDYRHKPANRIPYPQRPIWLCGSLRNIRQFDPLGTTRLLPSGDRYPPDYERDRDVREAPGRSVAYPRDEPPGRPMEFPRDRYGERDRNRDRDHSRSDTRDNSRYDNNRDRDYSRSDTRDNSRYDNSRGRDNSRSEYSRDRIRRRSVEKNPTHRPEKPLDLEELSDEEWNDEQKASQHEHKGAPQFEVNRVPVQNTTLEELICSPGRYNRPQKIVIILRGPPGSGKTYLAKLIKDKEVENGGSAPRILSLDDYFMVEHEKEVMEDGKLLRIKEMTYEYEAEMEESYRQSLIKAFKKTIMDGYFPFVVVDNVNQKVKNFGEMWSFAKQNGFQVYICQLDLDPDLCTSRNIHNRSQKEIEDCISGWEPTPAHHPICDASGFMQNAEQITEVEMEVADQQDERDDDEGEERVGSKWDTFDCSFNNLARLDGVSKPLRSSATMEEFLKLDEQWEEPAEPAKPGKKRVRWADLEEQKQQKKMKALGFVVGQTDWNRIMDTTGGQGALTQTKYIERRFRN